VEPETAENAEGPVLLKPGAAARRVGVVTRTLANWHRAGKITAQVTLGGQRRYPEPEVTALASARAGAVA
jgi:predicted site-specific integrase-resolvase